MNSVGSASSSDEASDTEMDKLSNLLWHKIKKRPLVNKPTSSPSAVECTKQSVPPATNEPQSQSQLPSAASQVDIGTLLASMKSQKSEKDKPQKSAAQSTSKSAYESRLKKDIKNLTRISEPCQTKWQQKKEAKLNRSQWSLGKEGWGSMRMMEMTQERKEDLMVLSMRATIDPTRHYKHADVKTPKFFQVGVVEEDPRNFYHDRIPKKKRKRTLVDELMADNDFKKSLKQQYKEVMATKGKGKALFQGPAPRKIKHKKKK